jgi:hypothetical protein
MQDQDNTIPVQTEYDKDMALIREHLAQKIKIGNKGKYNNNRAYL